MTIPGGKGSMLIFIQGAQNSEQLPCIQYYKNYEVELINRTNDVYIGSVVAQPTGAWAERLRVLSSSPFADNNWKGLLVEGVPTHLQSTAKLPFSKVPNPKMPR